MEKMYLYKLYEDRTARTYDETLAVACMQGLANRDGAKIYVVCEDDDNHRLGRPSSVGRACGAPIDRPRAAPWFWLDKMSEKGRWLEGVQQITLGSLDELFEVTKEYIKGIVIWDTAVPATVNVATTVAGVENLLALSEDLYETFGKKTGLPVIRDLRGMFDGHISGSVKIDAYKWAVENYLKKGLCSNKIVGSMNDSWRIRDEGRTTFVLERDRYICEKAFCFDLSPWDYFASADEPDQPIGIEKNMMLEIFETVYKLSEGKNMTEFCGFVNFSKLHCGQPDGVISEWEQVYIMTPYNFYQNTVANDVYNQSFHKWAPFAPLKQGRPKTRKKLENKVYFCMQVCDMDSATPVYDTMIALWHDPRRGELPLAWGINPNFCEVFPDLMKYFYDTRSENDYIVADSSGAGYFNATRVPSENWPTVVAHNKRWYDHADVTISGMVLDGDHATKEVLTNFAKFSPDGFCSLVSGFRGGKNLRLDRQVFDGMPVSYMAKGVCDWLETCEATAEALNRFYFHKMSPTRPEFLYYRLCYRNPSDMFDLYRELQRTNPNLDIELVDPYTYFDLVRQESEIKDYWEPSVGGSK